MSVTASWQPFSEPGATPPPRPIPNTIEQAEPGGVTWITRKCLASAVEVGVEGEPQLVLVELAGPLHVADGGDHHLELPVHLCVLQFVGCHCGRPFERWNVTRQGTHRFIDEFFLVVFKPILHDPGGESHFRCHRRCPRAARRKALAGAHLDHVHLTADDGTRLARPPADRRRRAAVCLPGGPMLDSAYLRDLGGLAAHRTLVRLDLRGTGGSETPADPASYRCDRQVADVEAVRRHLGLDRLDLLGHSAGANLAYRYVEAHPDRVGRLMLVTPSARGVGVDTPDEARSEMARPRAGEPWYAEAAAALDAGPGGYRRARPTGP